MTGLQQAAMQVFGGSPAPPKDYPYLAALYASPGERPRCASIAIANRWILTAGHCRNLPWALFPAGGVQIQTISSIQHPTRDLALLQLNTNAPSIWSKAIREPDPSGSYVALGWGGTGPAPSSNQLQISQPIPMLPEAECRDEHPQLAAHEFCAGSDVSNTCRFDSGGPLFGLRQGTDGDLEALVGITTRGSEPCSDKHDVFTRVDCAWIRQHLGSDTGCG